MEDTTSKTLAGHVTVEGRTYGPGDDIPPADAAKIKNPKAWASENGGSEDDVSGNPAGTTDGRRLATTVTVGGKSYGPNDFIPDAVASQIKNPKAWANDGKTADAEAFDNGGYLTPGGQAAGEGEQGQDTGSNGDDPSGDSSADSGESSKTPKKTGKRS